MPKDKAHNDLQRIRGAAQHLQNMIDNILDIAGADAGNIEIESSPVEVMPIVTEVLSMCMPHATRSNNQLVVAPVARQSLTERANPLRLKQVLGNLVTNACKFTRSGLITVSVTGHDNHAHISVADTRVGIREEDLERIFLPFVQLDMRATREVGGVGLGLDISRRFARMMGGDVTVTSRLGQDSTFILTLPLSVTA